MNYKPSPPTPVPHPTQNQASLHGNVSTDRAVYVSVSVLDFWFRHDAPSHTWSDDGTAIVTEADFKIDEGYIAAARELAVDLLRSELTKFGGDPVATRCSDCGRLLSSPDFGHNDVLEVNCGPAHVVVMKDGRALTLRPDGSSVWMET